MQCKYTLMTRTAKSIRLSAVQRGIHIATPNPPDAMLTDANKSNTRIVRLEPHIVRSPQLPHKRPPPRLTYSPRHISRYFVINTARATHPHHDPKPIPQRHRMKIDKCCQHHELIMIPSWPQTTRAWWACVSHGVLYIWCWMYVSYGLGDIWTNVNKYTRIKL